MIKLTRHIIGYTVLLLLSAVGIFIAFQFVFNYEQKFDFPNEGNLLKQKVEMEKKITNLVDLLKFEPVVVCISVSGTDPRTLYSHYAKGRSDIVRIPSIEEPIWSEGHATFLFAGERTFYIEKFDRTYLYFDSIRRDECRPVSKSLAISVIPPKNQYVYSKFSAEIEY